MPVILKILLFNSQPYAEGKDTVINEQGGTIGRAVTNALVLPDEKKMISRCHATVKFENEHYILVDSSLAGTFINDDTTPINNESVQLVDGMKIGIGDYTIACSISNESSTVLPSTPLNPFVDNDFPSQPESNGLLGASENNLGNPFFSDEYDKEEAQGLLSGAEINTEAGLFAAPEGKLLDSVSEHHQPENSLMAENISSLNDSFTPSAPVSKVSGMEQEEGMPEDFSFKDFFNLGTEDEEFSPAQQVHHEEPAITKATDFQGAVNDQVTLAGAENQSPIIQEGQQLDQGSILENISPSHENFMPSGSANKVPSVGKEEEIPEGFNFESLFGSGEEEGAELPPVQHVRPEKPVITTKTASPQEPPLSEQVIIAATKNHSAVVKDDSLLHAFLCGAQIENKDIDLTDPVEKMTRIGTMFRQFVDSTISVLRSRAEFKSMFRVNVTTIKKSDNNPLKFAVTTDEGLKHLINDGQGGFKKSVESIDEGFNDLLNHQLAMQAGIQASLAEVLRQFDPVIIENQYKEGLVLQKKSKCWEKYIQVYARLSETAVDDFFGDAFSEAYEQQMKQLKN